MNTEVFPVEVAYHAYRAERGQNDHTLPPVVEDLKAKARERGLWNLFLPDKSGISQLDSASLAEVSGWSLELAPEALNCQAPDTGNMELLHLFATDEQRALFGRGPAATAVRGRAPDGRRHPSARAPLRTRVPPLRLALRVRRVEP